VIELVCCTKPKAMKLVFLGCTRTRAPLAAMSWGRTRTCCCSLVSTTTQHQPVRDLRSGIHPRDTAYQAVPTCSCRPVEVMWLRSVRFRYQRAPKNGRQFSESSTIVHWHIGCVTLCLLWRLDTSVQQHCWVLGEW